MSLLGSVWHVIRGAGGDVIDLGKRVWHAIDGVYTFLRNILFRVGDAWSDFHKAVNAVDRAIDHWLTAGYDALKWTLTKAVPGAADWALRKAETAATAATKKVYKWGTAEINKARHWAGNEIKSVEKWATRELKNVEHKIAAPIKWIRKEGAQIAGLVLHPDKMAKWIVHALLAPLMHLILTGSKDILIDLIRGARAHETEVAHTMEDVLHKLL